MISCWQKEWSVSTITSTFLFPDPTIYLLAATFHTFDRLSGQILKWPCCQPFHVMRTSRLLPLPNTENGTCNSPEVTSVLPQLWPVTDYSTWENCCLSWEDMHFLKKENSSGISGCDNLSCSHSVDTLAGFFWLSISNVFARKTGIDAVFSIEKSCGRNVEFCML